MFAFFEKSPDLVCIAGKDGYFREVNPAVLKKLGYTTDELMSRPISSFIHPDDADLTSRERTGLLKGKTLHNFQNRYISKGGETIWLEWTSILLDGNEIVFAIAKDITERKRIEDEAEEKYIQIKSLASHFKSHIEEDRKYFAYELHDELAQIAAAVKMNIFWIKENELELSDAIRKKINDVLDMTELLIQSIQRISFSLRPNMLDDLGLHAIVDWQCKEFTILNNIPCSFSGNFREEDLSKEMKIDFFRIIQEALSNVMNHADAGSVNIRIDNMADKIYLSIVDDGKGFDVNREMKPAGLLKMKQRSVSINGRLTIKSEIGKGTTISVELIK